MTRIIQRDKRTLFASTLVIFITTLLLGSSATLQAEAIYNDGGYVALSDVDGTGYVMAIVFIEDGRIHEVRLTEMNQQGDAKPASYPWPQYHEAMIALPKLFVEANDYEVDAYTGATGTSRKAMQGVERALIKATGQWEGKYLDGTFFGRSPADDHGYGTAAVTIKDDRIVAVTLGEIQGDGSVKDFATYPHEITVQGKTTLEQRIVEANDSDVDGITGATGSSVKWLAAVKNALRNASAQ